MTLIYLVFGVAALYVSDVLFVRYLSDPLLSQVQTVKGGVEVLLTAGLIFLLTRRSRRQVRATQDQLERQNDELGLLHRVLRHNLRNKINVIKLHTELLASAAEPDESRCDAILETARQIETYAEQARRIRKATGEADEYHRIDLAEAVSGLLEDRLGAVEGVEVTTQVPDTAEVVANPLFTEAIGELVTNAVEHNDADTPRVTVTVDPEAGPRDTTTIRVVDNGPGIPEFEVDALESGTEAPLYHPSGMGLWFVELVVACSGGEFTLEPGADGGTVARIRIRD
jgi:signal transduction histidine kinase